MKRRGERDRPPIPEWLLDGRPMESAVIRAWAADNGYRVLEVLRAREAAHRARWGIDAPA